MIYFTWDKEKESINVTRHGVDFDTASRSFQDPKRKIFTDSKHSASEDRFFCIASVDEKIITVRFTYRGNEIRIYGAGYWRKGRRCYEKKEGS